MPMNTKISSWKGPLLLSVASSHRGFRGVVRRIWIQTLVSLGSLFFATALPASGQEGMTNVFATARNVSGVQLRDLVQREFLPKWEVATSALIGLLEKPRVDCLDLVPVYNMDIRWVSEALTYMGTNACDRLIAEASTTNAYFRANVLRALSYWDDERALNALVTALSDLSPSEKITPLHERPPKRVCDVAFEVVRAKIGKLGFSLPVIPNDFRELPEATRDIHLAALQQWWQSHKDDVGAAIRQ